MSEPADIVFRVRRLTTQIPVPQELIDLAELERANSAELDRRARVEATANLREMETAIGVIHGGEHLALESHSRPAVTFADAVRHVGESFALTANHLRDALGYSAIGPTGPPGVTSQLASDDGTGGFRLPNEFTDAIRRGEPITGDPVQITIPPSHEFRTPVTFADPAHALLFALSIPTPRGDGGHEWYERLWQAFQAKDRLPWLVFADWCSDSGYTKWEEIARATATGWGLSE